MHMTANTSDLNNDYDTVIILVYFGGKNISEIVGFIILKTPNVSTTNPILIGACIACALKH